MNDYIADLLREQEERGNCRSEYDWRRAWEEDVRPVSEKKKAEAGSGGSAGEGTTADKPGPMAAISSVDERAADPVSEAAGAYGRKTGEMPRPVAGEAAGSLWERKETGGSFALPGAWMDQVLRRSLVELPVSRRESRVVSLQKLGEGQKSGGWDADGLDRLVRRDARRFDGGFQLL